MTDQQLKQQQQWFESLMRSNLDMMKELMSRVPGALTTPKTAVPKFDAFDPAKANWENYLFQLQQHYEANSITEDNVKKSFFLSSCGDHLLDLLKKLFETTDVSTHTFSKLTSQLTQHFKSDLHILASRCKFLRHQMSQGQSYSDWIADLKGLAKDCAFTCRKEGCNHSYAEYMIRDMIVFYTPHDQIRLQATQDSDPTLKKMESIITAFELSQKASSILKDGEKKTNVVEVNFVQSSKSQNTNYLNRKSCPDCNVQHDRKSCKYIDFVCDKCHRRGHIQSVCLSSKKPNDNVRTGTRARRRRKRDFSQNRQSNRTNSKHHSYQTRSHNNQSTSNKNYKETAHFINQMQHEEICTLKETIGKSQDRKKKLFVSLEVNKIPLDFQLDTGATCSLIGLQGYRDLGEPNCKPTDRVLRAYGDVKIPIKGMMCAEVSWKGIMHKLSLLVVDSEYGSNIMGLDWFNAFDLSIKQQSKELALQVSDDICDKAQQQLSLEAKILCERYKSVFNSELGCSNSYVGHLVLKPDAQPKFCKYRPVPFAQKGVVKAEIERLVKLGILRRIETSQWAAPIVPVKKANGSIRICGDFKQTINPQLIINRHPLPRVLDIFHSLEGGCYFTKIDLSDAYLQIPLDEESQKICVISTEFGLFQYLRVPFGTASSTGIFQNYIDQLTAGLFGAAYVDDVIISGRSKEEHLENLKIFLERLESHGLRCRLEKCEFAKSQIEYLGHIIDATGIRPSESRLLAIKDLPEPSNLKELEAFVGKINYYNQFIENFAQIAAPLNKLRSKNVKFVWGAEQRKVFQIFKEKLMSVSRLVHFQNELPVSLATDASSHGIGAVISHVYPDGSEKPIAFASKTLTESQKRYSQIEKEALSIIYGIKKFHQYLFGRQFELITDHQPLVTIFNPSKQLPQMTIARLQRWAIILMSYTYSIRYRPTAQHANADCLSRLPVGPDEEFDKMDESCHVLDSYRSCIEEFPITSSVVAERSKKDCILKKVVFYIQHGWPKQLPSCEANLMPYFRRRLSLCVCANVVLLQTEHPRVVVPQSLQPKVLPLLHEGHWGETRMKQLSRRYCWWPGIDEMIHQTVSKCNACQLNASQPPKHYTSWPTTEHPWERIHIDYAGPFEKCMWLIIVDSFSKFPFVVRMQSTTSKATISALRSVFALEGLPKTIVSDNGTQFSSAEFKDFCQSNAITHLTSAPFNPESNGAAERMVRTFKTSLTKILSTTARSEDALQIFLNTYRSTPGADGKSPAEKLHGRCHRTILSALCPDPNGKEKGSYLSKFSTGQTVFVRQYLKRTKWVSGVVIKTLGRKMYQVQTYYGTWRRHQNQMRSRSVSNIKDNEPNVEASNKYNFANPIPSLSSDKIPSSLPPVISPTLSLPSLSTSPPASELPSLPPQPSPRTPETPPPPSPSSKLPSSFSRHSLPPSSSSSSSLSCGDAIEFESPMSTPVIEVSSSERRIIPIRDRSDLQYQDSERRYSSTLAEEPQQQVPTESRSRRSYRLRNRRISF